MYHCIFSDKENDQLMSDDRRRKYIRRLRPLDVLLRDTYHLLDKAVLGENLARMNLTHVNVSLPLFKFTIANTKNQNYLSSPWSEQTVYTSLD